MQSNALGSVMAKWAPYAEVYPVFDNLDLDRAFKHDARAHGVPEKLMKPIKQVLAERQDRKVMEVAPAGAEIMEKGSVAMKNLSESGIDVESLMAGVM